MRASPEDPCYTPAISAGKIGVAMICASLASLVWICSGVFSAGPILSLDLTEGWTGKTSGAWRMRVDHRDLLAMRHPWEPSQEGAFASYRAEVSVPEDWQGPVSLSFYCSDDYHTDTWHPDGSWLTAEGFIRHRYKRVLVNQQVVWNEDVSDPVAKGVSPRYRVALPVKPGDTFLLTLLAYDGVSSTTALAEDFYQSANDELKREADPNAANFMTHVYWGDVTLIDGDVELVPGKRLSESKVLAVHNNRWPLPPFGEPWPGRVARLDVSAPAGVPAPGFPLQCGVPLHAGKAPDLDKVRLQTPEGQAIPSQKAVLGEWPDGSVRWALFDLPMTSRQKVVDLAFQKDYGSFQEKVRVKSPEPDVTRVDAGRLSFAAEAGRGLRDVCLRRKILVKAVDLVLCRGDDQIPATTDGVSVVVDGPFRCTLELVGRFDTMEKTVGSYHLYCSAYAGLPYLKFWVRLFNSTGEDLPVSGLRLEFDLPAVPEELSVPSGSVQSVFRLVQQDEKTRLLGVTPVDAASPAYLAWADGVIAVRDFRELYPKLMAASGTKLVVDLVAGGRAPVVFTPGEAKSHEVWLALGDVDAAQFAATVERPPILQNAAYFCATGVLGPARVHEGVPVLDEAMMNGFGDKQWEDFGQRFGVRDFPDSPYYGGLPEWSNNYYERMLNLWSEWFLSGDRRWYDLAFDVSRHIMDVAIVHSDVPGHDWLGAMHGPGKNHVSGPWNPNLRVAGLALYEKLTGDPEARDAVLGVADFCVQTDAGVDGGSVRQQAGPFDAVWSAFTETGDVAYLEDGAGRVESVWRAMDRRRGVWPDEHGSRVYRGNVPWMVAQIGRPLYLWYRATGDVSAAQALVGLAESIICENTDWDHPGVVSGYSHNPHFKVSAGYDLLITPIIFAAYELTEDRFYLDAAMAQWDRWIAEKALDSPLNCYWNTPWLVWYLKEYGVLKAEGEDSASAMKADTPTETAASQ